MIQEELEQLKPQISDLKDQSAVISGKAPTDADTSVLNADITDVEERHSNLNRDIEALIAELETNSALASDYQVRLFLILHFLYHLFILFSITYVLPFYFRHQFILLLMICLILSK